MKYKRNRTQSLTVRLTPAEKKMLQSRAAAKRMSVTDYLLLSALRQDAAANYQPLLQKLGEVKEQLMTIKDTDSVEIYDALEQHENVCKEVMRAIHQS